MITAKNITKKFDGFLALDDVSFQIDEGCVLGLVGSNGSGKSTLLRLICGVLYPDSGTIGIDGIASFDNPAVKSQIVFLGDTPYFFNQSTLKEMAKFYASMYPDFSYETYKELLEIFLLDENKKIANFSKGMRRQASLILSISARPKYLLMDEAFDGLDVVMRRNLSNILLKAIEDRRMTVIIASHNLRELEEISDNILLIHNGKLIKTGKVDDLCQNIHKVQAAFSQVPELSVFQKLNCLKIEKSGSLVQMIVRGEEQEISEFFASLNPIFFECMEPSLEEVFIFELEVSGYDIKNILE
ncbi:MAG: ABC transporter ATP-binding protein [Clostridia bacterium]|nr:ABC transporter ATP-binding protein [Clostridia bacterium]